jgi:hypothetical protein
MEKSMNHLRLPISLDDVLRGKSIEWERLEYKAETGQPGKRVSL